MDATQKKIRPLLRQIFSYLICLSFCSSFAFAQEKVDLSALMDNDDVTVVYLSPTMLKMSNLRFSGEDVPSNFPINQLIKSVSSLYIFTSSNKKGIILMKKVFAPALDPSNSLYEQLFYVKEKGENIRIISNINENEKSLLHLLVEDADEMVALSFLGDFTKESIEKVIRESKNKYESQKKEK